MPSWLSLDGGAAGEVALVTVAVGMAIWVPPVGLVVSIAGAYERHRRGPHLTRNLLCGAAVVAICVWVLPYALLSSD